VEVHVTLYGILRDLLPQQAKGQTTLSLPDGATISDVLQQLKINRAVSAAVAGVQVENNQVLSDGDKLQLFRPIGGG
jgi:sulfur carrier protein ThiS